MNASEHTSASAEGRAAARPAGSAPVPAPAAQLSLEDRRGSVVGTAEPKVQLVIPATPRYLRLARLTAAGLAGDLGYPVDAIEDLRVAIDELCAAIIDGTSAEAELELTYREIDGGIVVEGRCRSRSTHAPDLHGVARELLNMLADEYHLGAIEGYRNFRLVKRAEGPDA